MCCAQFGGCLAFAGRSAGAGVRGPSSGVRGRGCPGGQRVRICRRAKCSCLLVELTGKFIRVFDWWWCGRFGRGRGRWWWLWLMKELVVPLSGDDLLGLAADGDRLLRGCCAPGAHGSSRRRRAAPANDRAVEDARAVADGRAVRRRAVVHQVRWLMARVRVDLATVVPRHGRTGARPHVFAPGWTATAPRLRPGISDWRWYR